MLRSSTSRSAGRSTRRPTSRSSPYKLGFPDSLLLPTITWYRGNPGTPDHVDQPKQPSFLPSACEAQRRDSFAQCLSSVCPVATALAQPARSLPRANNFILTTAPRLPVIRHPLYSTLKTELSVHSLPVNPLVLAFTKFLTIFQRKPLPFILSHPANRIAT